MAAASSSSSASRLLAFDGSPLEGELAFECFGRFVAAGEGINTIGGRTTLMGRDVFVKFLDRDRCCAAAFADSFIGALGQPSVGTHVAQVRMPTAGGEVPYAKYKGATKVLTGRRWALISRWLAFQSFEQHTEGRLSRAGKGVEGVTAETDRALLLSFAVTLALRMVVGGGDMGTGNFLYDADANHFYSVDLGSALGERMDPRRGKLLLESNLLAAPLKRQLVAINATETVERHVRERLPPTEALRALCLSLLARYPAFANRADELTDDYVLRNLASIGPDLRKLLVSTSRGGAKKTAAGDRDEGVRPAGFFRSALRHRIKRYAPMDGHEGSPAVKCVAIDPASEAAPDC